ncbi:MAG: ferrous iron transport protein B, partial [Bacteroidota bacterium]
TDSQLLKIALVGNPNSGKSSVFNQLTGLRQKIGNFPGVTVDKKTGGLSLARHGEAMLIDFPGTYSLFPTSQDERVVAETFCNPFAADYPDAIVYVADVSQLEKHLLLFTQLCDLGLPVLLVLNMKDVAIREGIEVDTKKLAKEFRASVVQVSARTGEGIAELKVALDDLLEQPRRLSRDTSFYRYSDSEQAVIDAVNAVVANQSNASGLSAYQSKLLAHHVDWLPFLDEGQRTKIKNIVAQHNFDDLKLQVREVMQRFDKFSFISKQLIRKKTTEAASFTNRVDRFLTHPVFGPLVFFGLMFLLFQAIFSWSETPMDWIDWAFAALGDVVRDTLPAGWMTDLLTDGIIAGLGGILIFIPQITILFLLIAILEEVGYMARAVYLFDNLMQRFGLNGRSIVALVSSSACAIPAVMSTRTISNWKERLITILVTPFISCSARIPVYTVLIGFVVPSATVGGIFNAQGIAFMGLYLLGIVTALLAAWVFKKVLKSEESSFLLLELPVYRPPVFKNIWLTVFEKVKTFTVEAGKIIMIISVILWILSTYGPSEKMQLAEQQAMELATTRQLDERATEDLVAAYKIEQSYAGHVGKFIEPAIRPLGFDWKIGIALITSFAAREVFVGTMATIYSIGSEEDEYSIRDRLARETDPRTGARIYDFATSLSLLIFYVFAMQCMSTLAVVRRETKSWKWPIVQFVFMTGLAYLGSLLVYQIFS